MYNDTLQKLAEYNAVGLTTPGAVEDCLNSRPKALLFQNTATPTAPGASQSAIITIGDHPWLLNCIELGSIQLPGNNTASFPNSFFLQFNLFDSDNEGLFGGAAAPRASTVFGSPIQIAYAVQPVKVFKPKTKMKLSWTNRSPSFNLGFELVFRGIEVLAQGAPGMDGSGNWEDKMRDLMEEYAAEPRVR